MQKWRTCNSDVIKNDLLCILHLPIHIDFHCICPLIYYKQNLFLVGVWPQSFKVELSFYKRGWLFFKPSSGSFYTQNKKTFAVNNKMYLIYSIFNILLLNFIFDNNRNARWYKRWKNIFKCVCNISLQQLIGTNIFLKSGNIVHFLGDLVSRKAKRKEEWNKIFRF